MKGLLFSVLFCATHVASTLAAGNLVINGGFQSGTLAPWISTGAVTVEQHGTYFAAKLGNSAEKEYYRRRVRSETLPVYRVTFPRSRVEEFRKAVRDAGRDESRVRIDPTGDPAIATIDKLGGDRVLASFTGPDVAKTAVPRQSLRPENQTGRRFEMFGHDPACADGDVMPRRGNNSPLRDNNI